MREGAALLQGIATCGTCGRKLKVHYQGKHSTPGYHCPGNILAKGRGTYCLRVGGRRVDDAVVAAFLAPSVITAPSSQRIGWSPVGWKRSGRRLCASSTLPRRSSSVENKGDRAFSALNLRQVNQIVQSAIFAFPR